MLKFWQLAALALVACAPPPPLDVPDSGSVEPDAGTDAGTGPQQLSWFGGTALTTGVNHHGTLIANDHLFVLGGVSGAAGATMNDAIVSAPIGSDGFLGAWTSGGTLPKPLAGFTFTQRDDKILLVGGLTMTTALARSRSSFLGTLGSDGTWGGWTNGPQLPVSRFHAAQATVGDFTYVIGGLGDSGEVTDTVYRSSFTGTSASAWEQLAPLPGIRSHEVALAAGKRLYVLAGLRVDTANPSDLYTDVLVADVADDGSLSAWRTASTSALPQPLTAGAGFEKDGSLYLVGGVTSVNNALTLSNSVYRAKLADDGTVGTWEKIASLPKARGHVHQTPLYNGHVYSAGGTSDLNHDSITDVAIGLFE